MREFVRTDLGAWLLAIVAAAALPCLNPNGIGQAMPLIASLAEQLHSIYPADGAAVAGEVFHVNLEYRRLADVPSVWWVAVLYFAASIFVVWQDRSRRVANALLLAGGMALSLLHVRALAIWGIFLMVPLGVAVAPSLQKFMATLPSRRKGALIGGFMVMCCVWNLGAVYNRAGERWGIGFASSPSEARLLQAIRASLPEGGNIFNWHPLGAYLRWHLGPGFLVAMDGHLVNEKSAAWKAYFDIEDSGDTGPPLIEKWNIQAVYHPVVTPVYAQIYWLPYYLVNDPNWRLAAMDRRGVLLMRTSKGGADERALNLQKMDYWRRVVLEARILEFNAERADSKDRARRIVEYARENLEELQKH